MARVLVIGASHGIGLETVRTALRSGHSVRALARSGASIPIQDANLDKVSGNALDPGTIRNALITVTGLGAGDSRGHGGLLYDAIVFPLLLKRVYDDKDVQEWIIRSSGLDWTIVRPGLLKDSPATNRYRVLTAPRDWRFGTISRADVADFLVQQVDDRAHIGTTPLFIS
jgi:uncharacterized protein YbjT (DUF2867 family)